MNKLKLLSIAAAGLLIINILLVVTLFMRKPHPNHEGPKKLIIEKLHFDEQQIKAYDTMVEWHRAEIKKSDEQILKLKNALYSHLNEEIDQHTKDSLICAITRVQTFIEQTHYKHFEDIKKLCNANQQKDFEALTQEIASLFGKPRPRERK
jgi:hypothetical protein